MSAKCLRCCAGNEWIQGNASISESSDHELEIAELKAQAAIDAKVIEAAKKMRVLIYCGGTGRNCGGDPACPCIACAAARIYDAALAEREGKK